ncbi:MAG: potassium transporter TrkG [Bellilinea sp.]
MLMSSAASANGDPVHWLDALFTATSAVSVTGLSVLDISTRFSFFGQLIILILIQVGGIGYVTMAIVISVLIGRKVGLRERLMVFESLGQVKLQGMVRLALYTFMVAISVEAIGALILWIHWQSSLGPQEAVWYAIFHSVAAFANAGFDLFGQKGQLSLQAYRTDLLVNIVIGGLIVIGSLGLPVLDEIVRWRRTRRFSIHTKLVLTMTGLLLVFGALVILFIETESRSPVGLLPWHERVLVSFFHSASARTGGYSTISLTDMSPASWLVLMALMFSGAATASMGGGIKINVLGILLVTLWSIVRGREDVEIFNRTIPRETIYKALAVLLSAATYIMLITILIVKFEDGEPLHLMFEVVSAFGTVGYSMGVTPHLSTVGKFLIILTMIVGRVGPLTFLASIAGDSTRQVQRYPEEKILIG